MVGGIRLRWFVFVFTQRPLAARGSTCLRGRGPNRSVEWRHTSEGGVALFCCSGEIWHGDERKRGREWDSLIGINGSSEVWTENVTMGSNDWKQNGKRQICLSFLHIHRCGPIHGSFDSEHNRLPLQTGAPAFMRVRASMRSTSGSVRIPLF